MQLTLVELLKELRKAKHPEDVFGDHKGTALLVRKKTERKYRELAKLAHPDKATDPNQKKLAEEAFPLLSQLWEAAEKKLEAGTYGDRTAAAPATTPIAPTFRSKGHTYTVGDRIRIGGTCGIFEGVVVDKKGAAWPAVIKAPHSARDNDLMEREAKALDRMTEKVKKIGQTDGGEDIAAKFAVRVPLLVESIKLQEPGSTEPKIVNAFFKPPGKETGWYTLEEIRSKFPTGVDTRIMAFICNRVLESLTLAHLSGVVHGAVTPNHVLIHAESHLGMIVDWTASTTVGSGEKIPYTDDRYAPYFPEEIMKSGQPLPASDIYMLGMCMVYILGGDPEKRQIPDTVEGPIRDFLNRSLQPTPRRRFANAEVAYKEFSKVIKEVFGARKFVELAMT